MAAEKNQHIQPIAWFPNGILPNTLRYVAVLRMPPDLLRILKSMGKKLKPMHVAPISGLHDLLAAHSHNIIAFQPSVLWLGEAAPRWLYIRDSKALDTDKLKHLLKAWFIATDEVQGAGYAKMVDGFSWTWDEGVDLQNDPELQKLLLPGLVVRWLLEHETPFAFKLESNRNPDEAYPMRLVPLVSERNHAELISEPILESRRAYSFVLRLWMEHIPRKGLALFARASMRRWHIQPLIKNNLVESPKNNRNKSVYMRGETGYLERENVSQVVFCRVQLRHYHRDNIRLHWVGNHATVMKNLATGGEFPDAAALAANPKAHFESFLLTKPAGTIDETGTGLWSNDHRAVFCELNALLTQWATPLPVWLREPAGDTTRSKEAYSQGLKTKVKPAPRFAGLQNLPAPARIVLLNVPDPKWVREIILSEAGALGRYQHRLDENPLCITVDDAPDSPCLLEIIVNNDPTLTSTLKPAPKGHVLSIFHTEESARQAIRIRQRVPKATQPSGYMVALPRYDLKPKQKYIDPKAAIKQGLLQSGYVSQFFDPEHMNKHRLTNAVRDLLRALGYRLNPFYVKPPKSSLPEQVDLIALTVIQMNARNGGEKKVLMPAVLEAPSDSNNFHVYLPDQMSSPNLYCSLYEAACALVTDNLCMDYEDAAALVPFFRQVLEGRTGKRPALLILPDQNLRRVFPELDIQYADLSDGVLGAVLAENPELRVARLRYSFHDEVPFCIPIVPKTKYQGLYAHPDFPQVFYSLHNVGNHHVKLNFYKLDKMGEPAVNPSVMQILLHNLQPGDSEAEWAGIVHRLRQESSHTDIATRLPQPLHNRNKLTEYLTRYDDESDHDHDDGDAPEIESQP